MVFSFEKHDQKIIIFDPEVYAFSQCIFGPLGANGGPRGTTGNHGGQRGGNARAQEISHKHKLLLYQRRQDPSSFACLGKYEKNVILII